MTPEERMKLGMPLKTLVGVCAAADYITIESDINGFAALLIRRANELEQAWEKVTRSKGEE